MKTLMQDVMDEKGQVCLKPCMCREEIVFGDDECLCMRADVEHRGVDTHQAQEQIDAPNVVKAVRAHGSLVLRKAMYPGSRKLHGTRRQT